MDIVEEAQRKMREKNDDFFIAGRKRFLENFQDGFTMGGEIDFEGYFRFIPQSVIQKLFFSRQKISATALFDVIHFVNEDIKHLDPVDQQTVGGVFEELKQTHKKFEHLLYDLFPKKKKKTLNF